LKAIVFFGHVAGTPFRDHSGPPSDLRSNFSPGFELVLFILRPLLPPLKPLSWPAPPQSLFMERSFSDIPLHSGDPAPFFSRFLLGFGARMADLSSVRKIAQKGSRVPWLHERFAVRTVAPSNSLAPGWSRPTLEMMIRRPELITRLFWARGSFRSLCFLCLGRPPFCG